MSSAVEKELIKKFVGLLSDPSTPRKAELFHVILYHTPLSTAAINELYESLRDTRKSSSTRPPPPPLPKSEPKFHLFSSLPKELRLHIWDLALPSPRLIELEIVDHTSILVSDAINYLAPYTALDDALDAEDAEDDDDDEYIHEDDEEEDSDDSEWQDLHDWHPNLRTRYNDAAIPSLLHVCSESRAEALKHYAPLSTGGYINYTIDALYLSRRCTVNEPPPFWSMNYGSAFELLDCTLSSAEVAQVKFLALERDIWDMEDGAGAALTKALSMVMIVEEDKTRPRMEKGEWEVRALLGTELRSRELLMEGLPDGVVCSELVRIGRIGCKPVFEFKGFSDYVGWRDAGLPKGLPRRWVRH